jgi:AcrR family transcriptional regulator
MAQTPTREQQALQTRARIAQAALELFVSQGYAETTIDQVAEAAGVGRRTVFRHFPTKAAMLFDHLAVRGDSVIRRLGERPASEPPLVSLHAVLRELCEQGYERRMLHLIRAVIATEPFLASEQASLRMKAYKRGVVSVLESRPGAARPPGESQALMEMAEGWYTTAVYLHLKQGERSLTEYFDHVVAACVHAVSLLAPAGDLRQAPETVPEH